MKKNNEKGWQIAHAYNQYSDQLWAIIEKIYTDCDTEYRWMGVDPKKTYFSINKKHLSLKEFASLLGCFLFRKPRYCEAAFMPLGEKADEIGGGSLKTLENFVKDLPNVVMPPRPKILTEWLGE